MTHELPSNVEAEKAVVGGVLVSPELLAETRGIVGAKDFVALPHREAWLAMLDLADRGEAIDVLTVAQRLEERGSLGIVGGNLGVSQLQDGIPKLLNVPWYARIVRRTSKQRQAILAAHQFAGEVAQSDDPASLLDRLATGLSVVLHEDAEETVGLEDALAGYLDDLELRLSGERKLDWLGTGFTALDELVGGWCPGELIVVAARPSIGKTAFALSSARQRASAGPVMYFSAEMSRKALGERLLASEARVDLQGLRMAGPDRPLSEQDWDRVAHAFVRLQALPLFIDDRAGIDLPYVRAVVRRQQLALAKAGQPPLRDVVIDYLQLLQGPGRDLRETVTNIAKAAKTLARQENVAVLLLSQLRRPKDGAAVPPPAPHVHELKESGAIEENADVVILLDRPEYYLESAGKEIGEHASVAWAHVAKQRQGPVGRKKLGFRKAWTTFCDVWWYG